MKIRRALREWFDRFYAKCDRAGLGVAADLLEVAYRWIARLVGGVTAAFALTLVMRAGGGSQLHTLIVAGCAFVIGSVLSTYLLPLPLDSPIHNSEALGSARVGNAVPADILCDGGVIIGRLPSTSLFRTSMHVVTCASTGGGKGIGCVIPNLLTYPGSVFVLDVKGENYAVTGDARRRMGQNVVVLNPFALFDESTDAYNWLDSVRSDSDDFISDAAMLADSIVPITTTGEHWDESAHDLIRALICYYTKADLFKGTMMDVRRALTCSAAEQKKIFSSMSKSITGSEMVARVAGGFLSKGDRERAAVLSTAQRHTSFLDDPRIAAVMEHSSFDIFALKQKPTTFYLIIPPDRLRAYGRFVRGIVNLVLASITRCPSTSEVPLLLMLDEFIQFGYLPAIEDAISLMRGYGARFWLFIQDLGQLQAIYPKWQSFFANSCLQAFATADYGTAHYLSQTLGVTTAISTSLGFSAEDSGAFSRETLHQHARSLMTPDEILALPPTKLLAVLRGRRPMLLDRINYLVDPEFQGTFGRHPLH